MITVRGNKLNNETVNEICKFTVLMGLFEKNKCDYGRKIDLVKVATEIETKKIPMHQLAEAIQGRVDLYENDIEVYVQYILEESEKVSREMSENKRKQIEAFISANGTNSIVGGLLAIYRIRNNLFHGIKEINNLNNQIELFRVINAVLEALV